MRPSISACAHDPNPHRPKQPLFPLSPSIHRLNEMLAQDNIKQTFGLSILLLDPDNDQLSFISCGDGSLLHLPRNVKLSSQNKILGLDPQAVFSEITDNWNSRRPAHPSSPRFCRRAARRNISTICSTPNRISFQSAAKKTQSFNCDRTIVINRALIYIGIEGPIKIGFTGLFLT